MQTHQEDRCTMQPQTPRFSEWLAAEKDASEMERKLHREMLNAVGGGATPDVELVLSARAKRARAQWLFDEAMQELKNVAESLHHSRIDSRPSSLNGEDCQQH